MPRARSAGLLVTSRQGLPQRLSGMQGARAPKAHGQSLDAMGTLGRPWVILLTYVLTAMELSCLFLQFSIIPVSTLPGQPRRQQALSVPLILHLCSGRGRGWGGDAPRPSPWGSLPC